MEGMGRGRKKDKGKRIKTKDKRKKKKCPRIARIYTNEKKKEGLSTGCTDWHELEKGGSQSLGEKGLAFDGQRQGGKSAGKLTQGL